MKNSIFDAIQEANGSGRDDDNGLNSGSAYLFDASTGEQLFKLLPSDGEINDLFGYSVAISNGIVAVGSNGDDDKGSILVLRIFSMHLQVNSFSNSSPTTAEMNGTSDGPLQSTTVWS